MSPSTASTESRGSGSPCGELDGAKAVAAPAAAEPTTARLATVGAAVGGYALLTNWLMVHAAHQPWAVALVFAPLLALLAGAAWQLRSRALAAAVAGGVALLAWVVRSGGVADIDRLYVLQHAGFHLALALVFGVTLRRGATPLISALALSVHGHLTPTMRDYTRRLTAAWALYFVAMVAVSFALYALAPWAWWSFFGNLLTPLAALAFFVGEHVLRYRLHPEFERVTLHTAIEAWQRHQRSPR